MSFNFNLVDKNPWVSPPPQLKIKLKHWLTITQIQKTILHPVSCINDNKSAISRFKYYKTGANFADNTILWIFKLFFNILSLSGNLVKGVFFILLYLNFVALYPLFHYKFTIFSNFTFLLLQSIYCINSAIWHYEINYVFCYSWKVIIFNEV